MAQIPVISLWQPYASLLFTPLPTKVHETRHWPLPDRILGREVAIHAAKRPIARDLGRHVEGICAQVFGANWRATLPRGVVLGTAFTDSCKEMASDGLWNGAASPLDWACGDWTPGRFAWRLEDRRSLVTPIAMIGRQGWWTIDLDLAEAA